ncbi:MAG: DUF4339 domain-containing protein [Myxococcales bacterium]|nr:DUF4339 domain-containing protein [Myxococcales bacterium]
MIPTGAGPEWHYMVGGQQVGPVPLAQLRALVQSGQLGPSVMVWTQGMPQWVPPGRLPVFGAILAGTDSGLGLIIPTGNISGASFAAGYCGLLGLIPGLGLLGIGLGIIGIMDLRKHPEKKGWGRAITGIVAGILFTLPYAMIFFR